MLQEELDLGVVDLLGLHVPAPVVLVQVTQVGRGGNVDEAFASGAQLVRDRHGYVDDRDALPGVGVVVGLVDPNGDRVLARYANLELR